MSLLIELIIFVPLRLVILCDLIMRFWKLWIMQKIHQLYISRCFQIKEWPRRVLNRKAKIALENQTCQWNFIETWQHFCHRCPRRWWRGARGSCSRRAKSRRTNWCQFHKHFMSVTYSPSKISCTVIHCMHATMHCFKNARAFLLRP